MGLLKMGTRLGPPMLKPELRWQSLKQVVERTLTLLKIS